MKKIIAGIAVIIALGSYVALTGAESFALGGFKLRGDKLSLDEQVVTVKGSAAFSSPEATLNADSIRWDLQPAKNGRLTVAKVTASGGVVIHARQVDQATKAARVIDATCTSAVMTPDQDTAILTGNVKVKVTDSQLAEPMKLSGEVATVHLKERKIEVQGSPSGPAELSVTPKEKPKSEPSQK